MAYFDNDRWRGFAMVEDNARYVFTVIAWRDLYATWRDEVSKKHAAGVSISLEDRREEDAELRREDYHSEGGLAEFVAQEEGFFLDEGIEVEFDWKTFKGTQSSWKGARYLERPQRRWIIVAFVTLAFLFALGVETGGSRVRFSLLLAERRGLAWLMLPFAVIGLWHAGLAVLFGYAAASFFWAQRESHISRPIGQD